jgi:hypothetical protein
MSDTAEVNWKEIALALGQRIDYLVRYCKPNLKTSMMNINSLEVTSAVDYIASGLEMLPGVKVDREMLGATPAERKKLTAKRKSETVSVQRQDLCPDEK